jgi:alcohol dehydrogenase class IV
MEYNSELCGSAGGYAAGRYAQLAKVLALPARTSREGTVSFIQAVGRLRKSLGIEDSIRALGIEGSEFEGALERMAEAALMDRCTPANPRTPSKEDLIRIYRKVG